MLTKLETARTLVLAIEALQAARKQIPVSVTALREAGSIEAAKDNVRRAAGMGEGVLYITTVELVIKHLWEQERKRQAAKTHSAEERFKELAEDTRKGIKQVYEACRKPYMEAARQVRREGKRKIQVASLSEALAWNDKAARNFKYDLIPKRKTVPCGVLWDGETVWVAPGNLPNFAVELTRWANQFEMF